MTPALQARDEDLAASDTAIAVKSAFVLGSSLVATWSVAIVVRLFLPRYLGPDLFGALNFADSFAATCFIVLGLGVETYIQKEIPVRPEHASDFLGGSLAFRALLSGLVFAAMAVVMTLTHRPSAVQKVAFLFGGAQLLVTLNTTLSALLHASRAVSGLAVVNVVSKLIWGAAVALALVTGMGLPGLAIALAFSEAVRAVALGRLARRHLGVELRIDPAAVKVVIVASLPFYLNSVANTVYAKVDVSMLAVLANDREVGWYGSASNLAGLALLIAPLIGAVLLPLLSRAASRGAEELYGVLRRAIEAVLLVALPISLFMGIGADLWVPWLFGRAFVPATLSLRMLAPLFVLTYLAMISATGLILLRRAWTVAFISFAALVLNPALNLALVPLFMRRLGPGGAGAGAALALLSTELCVTTALTVSLGARTFDRRSALAVGKAALSCLAVVAIDRAASPFGAARLALDACAYVTLVIAAGAVRLEDLGRLARLVLQRGREHVRA